MTDGLLVSAIRQARRQPATIAALRETHSCLRQLVEAVDSQNIASRQIALDRAEARMAKNEEILR